MVRIYDIYGDLLKEYPDLDSLVGADLSYEDLPSADLRDMDLTDANFHMANLWGACIDGAIIDGTDFSDTYLEPTRERGGGGTTDGIRGY